MVNEGKVRVYLIFINNYKEVRSNENNGFWR